MQMLENENLAMLILDTIDIKIKNTSRNRRSFHEIDLISKENIILICRYLITKVWYVQCTNSENCKEKLTSPQT